MFAPLIATPHHNLNGAKANMYEIKSARATENAAAIQEKKNNRIIS